MRDVTQSGPVTPSVLRALQVVGSAVVLGASIRAARHGVPEWDARAFRAINGLPDSWQYLTWLPMQAGALAAPLTLGTVVAIRGSRPRGLAIAASGLTSWGAAKRIKAATDRGRPQAEGEEPTLRIGAADSGLGFPSGHAAVAAAIATTAPPNGRSGTRYALAALAVTVGWTRIYAGAHYPLDVVGGWALGCLVGNAATAVAGTS
mgnify:CR=1 FL=1